MARAYDNLYETIASFENLYLAFRGAAKGKRGHRPFYIRDPKHRLICAAPFRDRVVHFGTLSQ